ncbi:MAG: hypothetical protein OXC81_01705 [Betaproteobacteria bacterium]|nr:hypothetical protein [Betaproteobacteria bacterium]
MKKIGFLIDPPERLDPAKDSSIELMRSAAAAGNQVIMFTVAGMRADNSGLHIAGSRIPMRTAAKPWHAGAEDWTGTSHELDVIMLRLEPPINERFRIAAALLEIAARTGTPVINDPAAVLIGEEKIAALLYPQLVPDTLISTNAQELIEFAEQLPDGCVVKKLGGMGGQGVFAFAAGDSNLPAAVLQILATGAAALVQRRLPDLASGDRRVFVIDGQPAEVMLNRLPEAGSHLANMAAGGRAEAMPIGKREHEIAQALGDDLKKAGVLFAGLDVIDGHLTEINISCPTGLVQVRQQLNVDLAATIVEKSLAAAGCAL